MNLKPQAYSLPSGLSLRLSLRVEDKPFPRTAQRERKDGVPLPLGGPGAIRRTMLERRKRFATAPARSPFGAASDTDSSPMQSFGQPAMCWADWPSARSARPRLFTKRFTVRLPAGGPYYTNCLHR
jgi:hypothetical protein